MLLKRTMKQKAQMEAMKILKIMTPKTKTLIITLMKLKIPLLLILRRPKQLKMKKIR